MHAELRGVNERRSLAGRRSGRAAGAVLLALAGLLAGCASTLSSQVTSFHAPETRFEGRRFAVVASPEQAGSLEYRAYADMVRKALVARGMVDVIGTGEVPTSPPPTAELAVTIGYRIDDGRAVPVATPTYGYYQAGPTWAMTPYIGPGGIVRYTWTPSWPMAYGVVGQTVSQAVVYRRELRVVIDDPSRMPPPPASVTPPAAQAPSGAATPAAPPAGRVYEGTAFSEGQSSTLAPVMPAMVRALFAEFPGPNGSTRIVRVPFDEPPR